jgi:hypothetical protein
MILLFTYKITELLNIGISNIEPYTYVCIKEYLGSYRFFFALTTFLIALHFFYAFLNLILYALSYILILPFKILIIIIGNVILKLLYILRIIKGNVSILYKPNELDLLSSTSQYIFGFYKKKNTDIIKGKNFESFKEIVDDINSKDSEIVDGTIRINTCISAFVFVFYVYQYQYDVSVWIIAFIWIIFPYSILTTMYVMTLNRKGKELNNIIKIAKDEPDTNIE